MKEVALVICGSNAMTKVFINQLIDLIQLSRNQVMCVLYDDNLSLTGLFLTRIGPSFPVQYLFMTSHTMALSP